MIEKVIKYACRIEIKIILYNIIFASPIETGNPYIQHLPAISEKRVGVHED